VLEHQRCSGSTVYVTRSSSLSSASFFGSLSLLLSSACVGHLWIRHTLPRVNSPRPLQPVAAFATQEPVQLKTCSKPFFSGPHRVRLGIFLLGSISKTPSKYDRPPPSTPCFVCFTFAELLMHEAAANAGCGCSCCPLHQRPHL
jgi:hypothetical protein